MKIKSDFLLKNIDGMSIVVAIGESAKTFNGVINLNETAELMWKKLAKGCTKDDLVAAVLAEYEVERSVVEADVDKFLATLQKENILDE